jgi:hypothetical protein
MGQVVRRVAQGILYPEGSEAQADTDERGTVSSV